MKLEKIGIEELQDMKKRGFHDMRPYTHKNPLVRWIFWKRLEALLEFSPKGSRALDFGAGSGVLIPSLSKNFKSVYAGDINTASLEYLKKKRGIKNLRITKSRGSVLPFKDNFFDVIFAADVLEHFYERKFILKEFYRVLKKKGVLLISGPTENMIYKISRRIIFWFWKKKEDHFSNINEIIDEANCFFRQDKIITLPCRIIPGFKIYKGVNNKN